MKSLLLLTISALLLATTILFFSTNPSTAGDLIENDHPYELEDPCDVEYHREGCGEFYYEIQKTCGLIIEESVDEVCADAEKGRCFTKTSSGARGCESYCHFGTWETHCDDTFGTQEDYCKRFKTSVAIVCEIPLFFAKENDNETGVCG